MPIRRHLKSFWWFIEGRVGGMGRPGFNQCHWFDLSLEEGVVLSWLGKQHLSAPALANLWSFLEHYGPKVARFYGLPTREVSDRLERLRDRQALLSVLDSMNAKAGILHEAAWVDEGAQATLRVTPSLQRVQFELEMLQRHNVSVVISLLEQPLGHAALDAHFEVHHVPVEDITPPSREQVYAFAEILCTALAAGKNVVTHCLAGVGRTTTMLMAAYLVQGYPLRDLAAWVQTCNPHFLFTGSQVAFLQTLADEVSSGHTPLLTPERPTLVCR
jgi:protein-tyrosine phosphatase